MVDRLNLKIEETNKLNHGATAGIQTIKLAATTWIQDTRYQTPDTYSQIKTVTLETTANHLSDLFSLFLFEILNFMFSLPFSRLHEFLIDV